MDQTLTKQNAERTDPRQLTNLADILSCLSAYQSEEAELSQTLTKLLSDQEPIVSSLSRINDLIPKISELQTEAELLCAAVSPTAETAARIGGKVRSLDEEMRRVREAGDRVSQVMELKTSFSAIQASLDGQDWESAARQCSKAMSIPDQVIAGSFSATAVPTSDNYLPPVQTLEAFRKRLLDIFTTQFEQASSSRDATATSRFFKLFPTIGWEAEGLKAYSSFVVDLVRVRAPTSAKSSSPLYYITVLTGLFESIAMIVDQHQPIVEKYYGSGKMTSVVAHLLKECDRVVKSVLEGWEEERSMKRKLADVSVHTTPVTPVTQTRKQAHQHHEEDLVDPRDIDKVLSEIAGMTGRWGLFKKFLSESLKDDRSGSSAPPSPSPENGENPNDAQLIESTVSHTLFERLLQTYYTPLEIWYTRTIIEKAHRLSNMDTLQAAPTSTAPDDVFYVLRNVLNRLLSTASVKAVGQTMKMARDVLDRNYIGTIRRKIEDVYRSSNSARGEKAERENRLEYIVQLNDLDVSASHMERLIRDLSLSPIISQYYPENEHQAVKDSVIVLSFVVTKTKSTLRSGVDQLFSQLARPKLRSLVSDMYKDVTYVLDEDGYGSAEYHDVVRKRFIKSWDTLVNSYKDSFTEVNFRTFFGLALDTLVVPWEKYLTNLKFTELGAIRFDHDLRAVMAYLSSQSAFGDMRERFVRLQQISTVLNLDNEEDVGEFFNSSGIVWKLTEQEARGYASLKA